MSAEKLSGDDKYQFRQGDYHILFEIVAAELIIAVVRVEHRREV